MVFAIIYALFFAFYLVFYMMCEIISIVLIPFRMMISAMQEHPKRCTKIFLGAVVSGLFAHLLGLPYVPQISCIGGTACLILDLSS